MERTKNNIFESGRILMAVNLRKFVNPRFLRTVDPELLGRLLERHRHG